MPGRAVKRPQLAVTSTEPRPAGDELVDQVANLADAVDALTRLVESLEHAVRNLPDNLAVALEK